MISEKAPQVSGRDRDGRRQVAQKTGEETEKRFHEQGSNCLG